MGVPQTTCQPTDEDVLLNSIAMYMKKQKAQRSQSNECLLAQQSPIVQFKQFDFLKHQAFLYFFHLVNMFDCLELLFCVAFKNTIYFAMHVI